jgi:hypothetical protein
VSRSLGKVQSLLQDGRLGGATALSQELGTLLAELAVELADAMERANFHEARTAALIDELTQLAAIQAAGKPDRRLVVTQRELQAIPKHLKLHTSSPGPGVRVYELQERAPDQDGAPGLGSSLILPGGRA